LRLLIFPEFKKTPCDSEAARRLIKIGNLLGKHFSHVAGRLAGVTGSFARQIGNYFLHTSDRVFDGCLLFVRELVFSSERLQLRHPPKISAFLAPVTALFAAGSADRTAAAGLDAAGVALLLCLAQPVTTNAAAARTVRMRRFVFMLRTWLLINFRCHHNETGAIVNDNLFTSLLQQRRKVQLLLAAQFLLLAQ
jgi:hypothetical protein